MRRLYTWTSPDGQYKILLILFFAAKDAEALYSQQKQERELTVTQIMNPLLLNSVQSFCHVQLFAAPWTAACQASLSIINSQSLLKLMFIESVMPSNHLILCCPLLLPPSIFPSIGSFQMSQFFTSGGQSIGASTSVSILPMNIQD